MADWSQLPKELLQIISEKLNSQTYLIRFRSVCSTWRFSIPKPLNLFPLNIPHFFYSVNPSIHKLDKHSIFLIKPPTIQNQQTLYRPWLVRISPTSTGKFNLWHPLLFRHRISFNLLDFNQLSVFDLGHIYSRSLLYPNSSFNVYQNYDRTVVTFQGEQILDIVTLDHILQPAMFRFGNDGWTKIPNVAIYNQYFFVFKGRPCVTDRAGLTLMIGSDLSVHPVAEPMLRADRYRNGVVYIMVENESELLLVHKYRDDYDRDYDYDDDDYSDDDDDDDDDDDHVDELVRFDVYRLDQKEKKWLKLENLGDRVLFLGQRNLFSASSLDLGFDNGNCVIYCNDNIDGPDDMSIFHLDQRRNSLLSNYPDYFKLFWPPPEWIISRCL